VYSRLAACVLLVVGCALLATPAQPPVQGNPDQLHSMAFAPGQTNSTLARVAFGRIDSAARCNPKGYPCGFLGRPCCAGLVCKLVGGSTRGGYQCRPRGSENAATGSIREELSANKLDHAELTDVLR
jgi:hypothetical protein